MTHILVAPNYNRREGDAWRTDTHWNRTTLFGKLRDCPAKADTGDLGCVTGRVCQSSYEAEGQTRYTVDLLADGIAFLAKANGKATDEERG